MLYGEFQRSDVIKGFLLLPRRWVVERTFSWFGCSRRLAKDFQNPAETAATFMTVASIQLRPLGGWLANLRRSER